MGTAAYRRVVVLALSFGLALGVGTLTGCLPEGWEQHAQKGLPPPPPPKQAESKAGAPPLRVVGTPIVIPPAPPPGKPPALVGLPFLGKTFTLPGSEGKPEFHPRTYTLPTTEDKPKFYGAPTTRVSVASNGTQANGDSSAPSVSGDGRFVAFDSRATNLVPGDTNGAVDVFVHDRETGQTTRVSVSSKGTQGNEPSGGAAISADGRFVAFDSFATNLVPGDTNLARDIFVRDLQTGTTTRVSVASGGTQANGPSLEPAISADGRYVAFDSFATNLVPGDLNGQQDIFVHDRQTGATTRVSVASGGTQANGPSLEPAISADGRIVAFSSSATNLVPDDTNGVADVFAHCPQTGQTIRVSVATKGMQGDSHSTHASLSADGRMVAFCSIATNLFPGTDNKKQDVFIRDAGHPAATTDPAVMANQANGASWEPSISSRGHVAFTSEASNIWPGDTNGKLDIYVHNPYTGHCARVSVATDGVQGNEDSRSPSISADDGRVVAFESRASNLVGGDTNNRSDIFVHDANPPTLETEPSGELALGNVVVGAVRVLKDAWTIRNAGGGTLDVSVSVKAPFHVLNDAAVPVAPPYTFSLSQGKEKKLSFDFTPVALGEVKRTITVTSKGGSATREARGVGVLPTVSIQVGDATALEKGANTATFGVVRNMATPSPLTVYYSTSPGGPGKAASGSDYTLTPSPSGQVTIPAGQTGASIKLTPKDDAVGEGDETATLTLTPSSNYSILFGLQSATVTILDNEPVVSILATDPNASEGGIDKAIFTVTRSVVSASPLTVLYDVSAGGKGRATCELDYTLAPLPVGVVTIPAGQASATITLRPKDDESTEGPEIATLSLSPSTHYWINPSKKLAVATIADND